MTSTDFYSDLSKDLYGTRRLAAQAEAEYAAFVAAHPGETPTVYDWLLMTADEFAAASAPRPVDGVSLNGAPLLIDPATLLPVGWADPEEAL